MCAERWEINILRNRIAFKTFSSAPSIPRDVGGLFGNAIDRILGIPSLPNGDVEIMSTRCQVCCHPPGIYLSDCRFMRLPRESIYWDGTFLRNPGNMPLPKNVFIGMAHF